MLFTPKGVRYRFTKGGTLPALRGALFGALLAYAGACPSLARADDNFHVKNGALVGDSDLPLSELPPAMTPHAVIGDPSSQDLYVIGLLGDFIGNAVSGTPLRPVGVRYGRRIGRSDARIVVGPADLLPTVSPLPSGVTLSGGVAIAPVGSTLAVAMSTGSTIYFLDTRTLKGQYVAPFGVSVSLSNAGLPVPVTKVGSVVGLGTKIYAADVTAKVVAQVDLMTGTVASCQVDAQVLGLSVSGGQVQAATTQGTATLADTCAMATTSSTGAPPMAPSALSLSMPVRPFELSERVLELSFLNAPLPPPAANPYATLKVRRGLLVSLPGSNALTVTVNNGTCQNTKYWYRASQSAWISRGSAAPGIDLRRALLLAADG